jgi:DNA-binding CsgD family transcriptional regulator
MAPIILCAWFNSGRAALCMVDCDCNIIRANEAARTLLGAGGMGLTIQSERLVGADSETNEHLRAALRGRLPALVIARAPSMARAAMLAYVEPLADVAAAMVRLRWAGMGRLSAFRALAQHYGLSPQQARVAAEIIYGRSVEHIADKFGIRVATVRSHLKVIFHKLVITSQAELVSMLVRHLPW